MIRKILTSACFLIPLAIEAAGFNKDVTRPSLNKPNNNTNGNNPSTNGSQSTMRTCQQAYSLLAQQCIFPMPHLTPLNATHSLRCEVVTGLGKCQNLSKELDKTISRSTWWHCDGNLIKCLRRFDQDILTNLRLGECSGGGCPNPTVPAHFVSLRNLAKRMLTSLPLDSSGPGACRLRFGEELELIANVVVQKSRFCRFDIDLFGNMVEAIAHRVRRHLSCLKARMNGLTSQQLGQQGQMGQQSSFSSYSYLTSQRQSQQQSQQGF